MTITRKALCRAKACPFPSSPEWHLCIICGAQAVDHQHVDARRMGGSKLRDVPENIVMLCRPHHEERTLNKWRDEIRVTVIGRFYIQIFGDDTAKAYPLPAPGSVAEPSEDDLPRGIAGSATEPGASRDDGEGIVRVSGAVATVASPSSPGASVPDSGRKAALPSSARRDSRDEPPTRAIPAAVTPPSTPGPPNWPVRAAGTAKDYFATAKDWQAVEKQKSPSDRGMFVIPGRPVPAARPRVTSRGVYYNKRYRDWLDAAKVYARLWALGLPLIEGPVTLSVDFYGARKNADSDNLLKGVMDALTGTVIVDDSQISEIVVKRWPVSKGDESFCRQDSRTEVRILA